jgi:uncharacterized protein YjdB
MMRIRWLAPAALLPFAAAALPGCSDPLASCGFIQVVTLPQDSLTLAVGDTVTLLAATTNGCPDKIGPAVGFDIGDSTIAAFGVVTDTSAAVIGVRSGSTFITATSRDRANVRTSIPVVVAPDTTS